MPVTSVRHGRAGIDSGDGPVEAQRVARQVVQVGRVGRRVALELVHVAGAHQREDHQQDVQVSVAGLLRPGAARSHDRSGEGRAGGGRPLRGEAVPGG